MPSPTVEQLQKKEASIKKAIAALGETPDKNQERTLRKKLKRIQRRRRLDVTTAAKNAPKAKPEEPKAEAKPEEPKAEAKPEEPKAEAKPEEPKAEAKTEAPAKAEKPAESEAPAEESKEE